MAGAQQAMTNSAMELESINPATGEVFARWAETRAEEILGLIARARAAQAGWGALRVEARCEYLARLRDALFARRDEMAQLIAREAGKPLVEALFQEILVSLDTADYFARRGPELLRPERIVHHLIAAKQISGSVQLEPYGVVAIISPWNYPLSIPLGQMIPALAAGNAVILKPSELTPAIGHAIGELMHEAGLPADVVQIVYGGGEIGRALTEGAPGAPRESFPDKVIFTGSVETGRRVAEACARQLIPSVLELGGKDAMIVLEDADIDIASSGAVWGAFTNCGQACLSVERLFVVSPEGDGAGSRAARFCERVIEKTGRLKMGAGTDASSDIGPLIRPRQMERIERQLADAVARGARILCGGRRRPELGPGFFEPTVVTGVTPEMLLMREETFGPVLPVISVRDAEEAVRLANDSEFGLAASIWTHPSDAGALRGRELAGRLRAGSVMVNDVASYYGLCEAPHGGRGASGWGRTHGRFGLAEMVQVKYVATDRLPRWPKAWWYGYNAELGAAAGRMIEMLFAPGRWWSMKKWRRRVAGAWGARRALPVMRRPRPL